MEKIQVKVQAPKETWELGEGVVALLKALKDSLDDGFQPGEDIPALVAAAVTHLGEAVKGVSEISNESKDKDFKRAVLLTAANIYDVFVE